MTYESSVAQLPLPDIQPPGISSESTGRSRDHIFFITLGIGLDWKGSWAGTSWAGKYSTTERQKGIGIFTSQRTAAMSASDIFLGLIAILFPPLAGKLRSLYPPLPLNFDSYTSQSLARIPSPSQSPPC